MTNSGKEHTLKIKNPAIILNGNNVELNIAFSETPPSDTSKLWIKTIEPKNVTLKNTLFGNYTFDEYYNNLPLVLSNYASCKIDNYIYLFGGIDVYGELSLDVYKYNLTTNKCTKLEIQLPATICCMCCARVNNNIYFFGGWNGKTGSSGVGYIYNSIYVFDIETETFRTLTTKLPKNLTWSSCIAYNDYIYIFGGFGSNNQMYNNGSMANSIFCFNTRTEQFMNISTTIPISTYKIGTICLDEYIYLLGGMNTSKIYRFSPQNNSIEECGALPTQYAEQFMMVNDGSNVYYINNNKIVLYNILTKESSVIYTLSHNITNSSIHLDLNNKNFYILGGTDIDLVSKFTIEQQLKENEMVIIYKHKNNMVSILKDSNYEIMLGIERVYMGDSNKVAQLVEAYIYDENLTTWNKI